MLSRSIKVLYLLEGAQQEYEGEDDDDEADSADDPVGATQLHRLTDDVATADESTDG